MIVPSRRARPRNAPIRHHRCGDGPSRASDSMPELILHHFAISPYAEKIRVVLGLKNLPWRSVDIPMVMPKPDLVALTGGYRRTPVLQIGADIYCDTALIAATIDRLAPEPPLWPRGHEATATALARHADTTLFECASVLFGQPHVFEGVFGADPDAMRALKADRAAMRQGGAPRPTPADGLATLRSFLARLEAQLSDGRIRLLGDAASLADCAVYHPLWFIAAAPGLAELLDPFAGVLRWMAGIRSLGHGRPVPLSSTEAIEIARASTPQPLEPRSDGEAFAPGDRVEAGPTDYGFDPTMGELVRLTADEIVVARTDARAGRVRVHLPRLGYQLRAGRPSASA